MLNSVKSLMTTSICLTNPISYYYATNIDKPKCNHFILSLAVTHEVTTTFKMKTLSVELRPGYLNLHLSHFVVGTCHG